MRQYYTYIHCKPNGTPFYVGKGFGNRAYNFEKRNPIHQRIVNKYGIKNIFIYIFNCESEEQAYSDEKNYIKKLREDGYILANIADGGEGGGMKGRNHSEETKKKMSEKAKSILNTERLLKLSKKGFTHSEETKKKLSEINKGKKLSEETKKKMSERMKGNTFSRGNKNHFGHRHSEETKKIISEKSKNQIRKKK